MSILLVASHFATIPDLQRLEAEVVWEQTATPKVKLSSLVKEVICWTITFVILSELVHSAPNVPVKAIIIIIPLEKIGDL